METERVIKQGEPLNIAVIGVGGVGGYFGGKLTTLLSRNRDLKIYFIARNEHLREIQKNGLLLATDEGEMVCSPTMATDDFTRLPILDIVLICVKGYDLENALNRIKNKTGEKTIILPLLNGVDIYKRIKALIPASSVLPSCVYVGTHIERPGKVSQKGGACIIHLGKDPEKDSDIQSLVQIFDEANINYRYTDSPDIEIWNKYIFIASFGLVSANYQKTIGQILDSEKLVSEVTAVMEEIRELASKQWIVLPPTIIEDSLLKGRKFPFDTKTSFQRDYEITDKQDERDLFGGAILKLGEKYGVDTPVTRKIYNSLQARKPLDRSE